MLIIHITFVIIIHSVIELSNNMTQKDFKKNKINFKETQNYFSKSKKLKVSKDIIQDAVNITNGVYAPLVGFLYQDDFLSALDNMRLKNGAVWSIPIVLDIGKEDYKRLKNEKKLVLTDREGKLRAILDNIEIYPYNKEEFALKVFGTVDNKHPWVAEVMAMGEYLVGGKVIYVENSSNVFTEYNFTPAKTKKIFQERGWQTIVAFQTRNVPHCGHEYLQKYALQNVDGLFVQPVIGEKKLEDFKDEYIISAYEILIDKYYPKDRVVLGILPIKMRYAGPREAIMHALIRKNFGCTHFIVGRDHAGVGNYYYPTAAQDIFNQFSQEEIGIEILKYPEVVYNKFKKQHCFINECKESERINFSGTKLRESIKNKEQPPSFLIRPEVYHLLTNSYSSLVDNMYKSNKSHKGFVLWFTGLSAAGKTTVADKVFEILKKNNVKAERLDGDVVRESLTKDLGFSKEDRDENIRRVSSVARLLSRHGIGVLASFISPYRKQREGVRMNTKNFIEVFVDAPLEICEKRDEKGLYTKARKGEILNFTGISDPYEEPKNPDIHLKTDEITVEECAEEIINHLKKHKYIEK